MTRIRGLLILVILLLFFSIDYAQEGAELALEGARVAGMGGAFVGLANDVHTIPFNPAGLVGYKSMQLSGIYSRRFWGLQDGNALHESALLFSRRLGERSAVGIGASQFFNDKLRESKFSLVYTHKTFLFRNPEGSEKGFLSFALGGNLFRNDYNTGSFSDEFDFDDPLFRDKAGAMDFGVDFSGLLNLRKFNWGFKVANLNQPNPTIGKVEAGKLPITIRTGLSYSFRDIVVPSIGVKIPLVAVTDDNPPVQDDVEVSAGAEIWVWKKHLGFRGGYNTNYFSAGFGYYTRSAYNLGFDYAYLQSFEEGIKNSPTHKVSVSVGFPEPEEPYRDLAVIKDSLKCLPSVVPYGTESIIQATFTNLGGKKEKDVAISAYAVNEEGTIFKLKGKSNISINPREYKKVEWKWIPIEKGYYTVYANIDDDGSRAPKIKGVIFEGSETNNQASFRVPSFMPPSSDPPQVLKAELELSRVSFVKEEVPLMPFIHYDAGESGIHERFDDVINTIAERINENPDINLRLYGFYDPGTDGTDREDLAFERARIVKSRFEELGIPSNRLEVAKDGYDLSRKRADKVSRKYTTKQDSLWVAEENRRLEFRTYIVGQDSVLEHFEYTVGQQEPSLHEVERIAGMLTGIKTLMDKNPEIVLLFVGLFSLGEEAGWDIAFDRALSLREKAVQVLGEDYRARMYVLGAREPHTTPGVSVFLNAEGLVFRPRKAAEVSESSQLPGEEMNQIDILNLNVEAGVKSFQLDIKDEEGNLFSTLASGNEIPSVVPWNWRDKEGNLPDSRKQYHAELFIEDSVGQNIILESKRITVNVLTEERRRELIIVNFTFGGTKPESKFLESRIENAAREFIDKVNEPKRQLTAFLAGHTDKTGPDEINQELSEARAEIELRNFRKYLIHLLNLNSEDELDQWLGRSNTTLESKGYSFKRPYATSIWKGGRYERLLVGNNKYPEGRYINRRVTLEFRWSR
ncbi:type IX secretion system membrane protein PorP/SprF [bacterium]|nr:type IX secretion system membrane protein PorP/SprF [bacterium]